MVVIFHIELSLTENSFWAPLGVSQRIKPETRSVLSHLIQNSSLVLLHSNATVLQEFSQKVV